MNNHNNNNNNNNTEDVSISTPYNVTHTTHVNESLVWSGEFEFFEKLGEGSYGSVYKAQHKHSGLELAIKVLPIPENEKDLKLIENEINILQQSSHPSKLNLLNVHYLILH